MTGKMLFTDVDVTSHWCAFVSQEVVSQKIYDTVPKGINNFIKKTAPWI